MSLALLLDEQIAPAAARQARARNPAVWIQSVYEWKKGAFTGVADRLLLRAAAQEELTLVTFDRKSIPPILVEWGALGISHSGVIFVDDKTIRTNGIGGLVRAILSLWEAELFYDDRGRPRRAVSGGTRCS